MLLSFATECDVSYAAPSFAESGLLRDYDVIQKVNSSCCWARSRILHYFNKRCIQTNAFV